MHYYIFYYFATCPLVCLLFVILGLAGLVEQSEGPPRVFKDAKEITLHSAPWAFLL